jgi:aryl carrier-like protein
LLCEDVETLIDQAEVIVVGNRSSEAMEVLRRARSDHIIVDLTGHTLAAAVPAQEGAV